MGSLLYRRTAAGHGAERSRKYALSARRRHDDIDVRDVGGRDEKYGNKKRRRRRRRRRIRRDSPRDQATSESQSDEE